MTIPTDNDQEVQQWCVMFAHAFGQVDANTAARLSGKSVDEFQPYWLEWLQQHRDVARLAGVDVQNIPGVLTPEGFPSVLDRVASTSASGSELDSSGSKAKG